MTPLRQRMIDDLRIRNRSPRTIDTYVSHVERFAKFHRRSPDRLGAEDVRTYQLHLLESGTSWSRFNQAVCALKFLYRVTLHVAWPVAQIPYGRKPRKLRVVLSQDEVVRLLLAVDNVVCRMALMTAYAAGLRITELVALKAEHIDSARMLVHVEQGKGQKARLVPLSEVLLGQLRDYWHDQPSFDAGREIFHFEHVVPVSAVRTACCHQNSEGAVFAILKSRLRVAWILKSEDAELTRLGHRSNRPDPDAAYRNAGIRLVPRKGA
jgi:integrase/recombinase XerD